MDTPWPASHSTDDDLIDYSVKRWAPFVCRQRLRIVSVSTDDILHEYARRLTKPVSEIIDRYRKIHNSRRRHRPKRGLSMIWDVATNRPRVMFYWTNGRSHFWCCDPHQLCPARFLGDPKLPSKETIEDMVDYSLNVLSFFDPSPVIEGARHRPLPEYLVALYDDEDSSASEETFQASLPTSSRTPSPTLSTTMDDPIIPYRPDESSSDIVLSESDDDKKETPERHRLQLQSASAAVATSTQMPRPMKDLRDILERADIDNVIAAMQEARTGNDLIRTVETIRHRSIFSPMALYSPLIAPNITFPANVRPAPVTFDIPRPIQPARIDAETQTEFELSQSSVVVAPTQDQPLVCSDTMMDVVEPERPSQTTVGDEDISLSDVQQWLAQSEDSQSQSTSLSYWRLHFPYILHFCRKAADPFESRCQFQIYIRFDYEKDGDSPRYVAAASLSRLSPSILVKWVCNQSLIEAPFVSTCKEQYALVPFAGDRGVCLCMNEAAWQEFGEMALLETKRRKPVLTGPIETAQTWNLICKRFLKDNKTSYSIDRFHDDIIDALTDEDTLPDNSALIPSPPNLSETSDKAAERRPLSDLSNGASQPERLSAESEAPTADCQSQPLGCHVEKGLIMESQSVIVETQSQTLDYLMENIASQLPIS